MITKDPGLELVDPEALFRKLPYASWRSWPEPEREAISRFMREMWQAALHTEPEDLAWDGVAQWLCALANCEDDMTPYFQIWLAQSCSTAYRNLAKIILELGIPYRTDVPMGYWEGRRGSGISSSSGLNRVLCFKTSRQPLNVGLTSTFQKNCSRQPFS